MKILEIVQLNKISPWSPIDSPKFKGWSHGVAFDIRKLDANEANLKDTTGAWFNAYEATYQFLALCTSEVSAQAAKRLLEI